MSYHAHNGVGAAPHVAAAALHHLVRHAHPANRFARLRVASAIRPPSQAASMTVAQMMAQDAARPKMVATRSASQRMASPSQHAVTTMRETLSGLGTLPPFGGWGSAAKRLRMVGGNYF
jgi:hypothetical protein